MGRSKRIVMVLTVLGCMLLGTAEALAQGAKDGADKNMFQLYVIDGGPVVWAIEIPMSIAMVALSIMFVLEFRRAVLMPPVILEQMRAMLDSRQYREAIEFTAAEPSMLSTVVHASLSEAASGYGAMERAMEEAVDERVGKQLRKIEFLNIIGNVAPMVGLFGTVLGMIQTFEVIRKQAVPDPSELAGGISVALVTTFWGLLIAIPALSVFALLRNQIEGLASEVSLRTQELLSIFNPSAQRAAAAKGGPAPAAPGAPVVPAPVPPRPAV